MAPPSVYTITAFSGYSPVNAVIHGVDSSELPSEVNYPLCTLDINCNKVRIYSDPDCDCGKRRNKKDKSYYVIGYRMHTPTAINPTNGHSFPNETCAYIVAPASEQAKIPENVLQTPVRVTCNDSCEIPMNYLGTTLNGHDFRCGATPGECMFASSCPKSGIISFDNGHFQPMPTFHNGSQAAIKIRKNCERPL